MPLTPAPRLHIHADLLSDNNVFFINILIKYILIRFTRTCKQYTVRDLGVDLFALFALLDQKCLLMSVTFKYRHY